jgi:hypothetical protein
LCHQHKESEVMALKFILKPAKMQAFVSDKVTPEHKESYWEMFLFGLVVIALLGVMYLFHIIMHSL